MANYMANIANMLGVELDEEFRLTNNIGNNVLYGNCVLKINAKEGLMYYIKEYDFWKPYNGSLLNDILAGKYGIEKQPWMPKKNEMYWTYDSLQENFSPYKTMWMNTVQDYTRLKCGMIFRTEAEAIEGRPRIYRELTGKEWRREIECGLRDGEVLL